ncbi:YdcF family protein [Dankookia sp. P2]|uniref:YdcF family protein n=1 Tax=Dankookia sp. P2 TaxID=3423955 RepID=UPI003D679E40
MAAAAGDSGHHAGAARPPAALARPALGALAGAGRDRLPRPAGAAAARRAGGPAAGGPLPAPGRRAGAYRRDRGARRRGRAEADRVPRPAGAERGRRAHDRTGRAAAPPSEARLVFTGGTASLAPGALSEADVARQLWRDLGVPADRMEFEDQSRNTHENAVNTLRQIHPKPGETWLLVTSASHMPRSMGVFRKAGWHITPGR